MLRIQVRALPRCFLHFLLHHIAIFRMDDLAHNLERWLGCSVDSSDLVGFLSPEKFSAGNLPATASRVTQFLCLSQVGFAAPQSSFSLLLLTVEIRVRQGNG